MGVAVVLEVVVAVVRSNSNKEYFPRTIARNPNSKTCGTWILRVTDPQGFLGIPSIYKSMFCVGRPWCPTTLLQVLPNRMSGYGTEDQVLKTARLPLVGLQVQG